MKSNILWNYFNNISRGFTVWRISTQLIKSLVRHFVIMTSFFKSMVRLTHTFLCRSNSGKIDRTIIMVLFIRWSWAEMFGRWEGEKASWVADPFEIKIKKIFPTRKWKIFQIGENEIRLDDGLKVQLFPVMTHWWLPVQSILLLVQSLTFSPLVVQLTDKRGCINKKNN